MQSIERHFDQWEKSRVLMLNVIPNVARNLACHAKSNRQGITTAMAAREISPIGRNDVQHQHARFLARLGI